MTSSRVCSCGTARYYWLQIDGSFKSSTARCGVVIWSRDDAPPHADWHLGWRCHGHATLAVQRVSATYSELCAGVFTSICVNVAIGRRNLPFANDILSPHSLALSSLFEFVPLWFWYIYSSMFKAIVRIVIAIMQVFLCVVCVYPLQHCFVWIAVNEKCKYNDCMFSNCYVRGFEHISIITTNYTLRV